MNKHYFINRQRGEEGPFTHDELSNMRLLSDTKVWYEGLSDWKNISEVDELSNVVIKRPPPINKAQTVDTQKISPVNENIYIREDIGATYVGVLLGILTLGVNYWVGSSEFSSEENYNSTMLFLRIGSLSIRLIVLFYIIDVARRQNKSTTGWGWFAFLLPTLALIIIGLHKKIFIENHSIVNEDLVKYKKQIFLDNNLVLQFLDDKLIGASVQIKGGVTNNGIYRSNMNAFEIHNKLLIAKYSIRKIETRKGVLEVFYDVFDSEKIVKFVWLNNKLAPDGVYPRAGMPDLVINKGMIKLNS
jgi:hypothetical protein